MTSPEQEIREYARGLGMHRVGFARADDLDDDYQRYLEFLAHGRHGEMGYLARNQEARRGVASEWILPGARTVVVCALGYHRADQEPSGPNEHDPAAVNAGPRGGTVARYARGADYHNFFRKRLRQLAAWMTTRFAGSVARPMVDTAPVLERAWAQRAGVGFVGKNGLVIAPGLGSYLLLGEVATTVELAPDEPMATRCGSCVRCLEGCPTAAFPEPYVLDARRCVSYLTIELRGAIPEALREGVGDRLFGCDVCQEVCPYNRTAPPEAQSTEPFAARAQWGELAVEDLLTLDEARFTELARGTPLSRPGRAGLARNAAVVLGNTGGKRHLPVLRAAAENDSDPGVRACAAWAASRIEERQGLHPKG